LITKLYDKLSITNKTKVRYLITRISDNKKVDDKKIDNKVDDGKVDDKVDDKKVNNKKIDDKVDDGKVDDKKSERVNIIFDYSSLIIEY